MDPTLVLFESFEGNGALCSPRAVFARLATDPRHAHLRFAWSLTEAALEQARADLGDRLGTGDRVEYVVRDSDRYRHLVGTAGYLVNNHSFPSWFAPQPDQVYVNTWHGIPAKQLGFDVRNGHLVARNTLRNFLAADVLVSAGPAATARLYHGAYRLAGLHAGAITELGTPRIDDQVAAAADPEPVRDRLAGYGVRVDRDAVTVLLAPTWKGRSFRSPRSDARQLARRVALLTDRLGPGHQILVKPHQTTAAEAAAEPDLAPYLVPNRVPTNELLGVCDVLVTDYSSLLFDAAATGLPTVLHRPDEADYLADRGLYPETELPGPVTRTDEDLVAVLRAVGTGNDRDPLVSHARERAAWATRWAPHEDGRATERLVDAVFGRTGDGLGPALPRDAAPAEPDRERVLIYLGGLLPNGITSAAMALLRGIDHRRYAVVAHFEYQKDAPPGRQQDWSRVIADLPAAVLPLIRTGPLVATPADKAALDAYLADPGVADPVRERALVVLDHEWRRCFGRCRFDHVIDFSGYSPLWAAKLTRGPVAHRAIWLHNDLAAEADNADKGHGRALRRVIDGYPDYDALVSVSDELTRINATRLGTARTRERFVTVPNLIDAARIRRLASGPTAESGARAQDGDRGGDDGWSGLATLVRDHGAPAVRAEIGRLELVRRLATPGPEGPAETTFLTVGRLSPEKNQRQLIEAFGRVHTRHRSTRLLIAGDGPLRDDLQGLVDTLDLSDAVTLLGHLANPYPVLAAADCFVLASHYEGLPMTVLEARVLGVPVLSTRFGSVDSALPPGTGLVVPSTVAGLADGMEAAVTRSIPAAVFDAEDWNAAALAALHTVLDCRPDRTPDQTSGPPVEEWPGPGPSGGTVLCRSDRADPVDAPVGGGTARG